MKPAAQKKRTRQEFCTKQLQQKDVRCCPGAASHPALLHVTHHTYSDLNYFCDHVWRHNIPTATTVINASFLVKNKTAREKSSCGLEWLQTQPKPWLNFLHPVTVLKVNLLLSTGIFRFRRKAKFSLTLSFKTQRAKQYWEYHQLWVLLSQLSDYKILALYL